MVASFFNWPLLGFSPKYCRFKIFCMQFPFFLSLKGCTISPFALLFCADTVLNCIVFSVGVITGVPPPQCLLPELQLRRRGSYPPCQKEKKENGLENVSKLSNFKIFSVVTCSLQYIYISCTGDVKFHIFLFFVQCMYYACKFLKYPAKKIH